MPYEQVGKKEPVCIADEVPFDIPESWEWVRLKSICNVVSARRVHQSDWKSEGIPFYRAREIGKLSENGFVDNDLFISEELYSEFAKSGIPHTGDLMVTAVGTLGKTYVVKPDDRFYYKDASVICFENFGRINPYYLQLLMESPNVLEQIKLNSSGTTVGTITIVKAKEYLLPVPPIQEQIRIVAQYNAIVPMLQKYELCETKLQNLNTTFPDSLKKSILQLAVQGKLVPQDSNDEPASVLLERIRAEKEQLIKEGKIKRDKHESVIYRRDNSHYEKLNGIELCIDDEIPFQIPDSWCWCRLGDILTKLTDGTHSTPKYTDTGVPFLSVKDMSSGYLNFNNTKYISEEEHHELYKRCDPKKGDILITKVGTTGIPIYVDVDTEFSLFVSVAQMRFNHSYIVPEYLILLLQSPLVQKQCTESTKGVGNKNWVMRDIANTLICIPPHIEQYRISSFYKTLCPLLYF